MIAKAVPKDTGVPDSFKVLAEYIAAAKEEGEKLDRFWTRNCDAGSDLKDLDIIINEVESVRQAQKEVPNKTYHLVVSFRPGEREQLSPQDLRDIEESFATALGFAEHQRVVGTHINTDNFHMHIAFNKVHPKTLKVATPFNDYKTLEKTARKLERKYGLFVDRGMSDYEFGEPKLSQQARKFEAQTWQQSFQNYVLEHRESLIEAIGKAEDWPAVHKVLADYDISMRRRGNGLALVSPDGSQAMKASLLHRSCGKGALEKRLGEFKPAPDPEKDKTAAKVRARRRSPKHRYEALPKVRHPNINRLWHRYLTTRKSPLKRSTLLSRTARNWKLFLIGEAYRDPLAMALIIAQQEMLHLILGDGSPAHGPTPLPKILAPALASWRNTHQWADASTLDWIGDRRSVGTGCRVDDEGNLVVPYRDLDGYIQGIRVLSKDGRLLDIGDLDSAGIVNVIDPGKRFGQGYAVFATDYANAAAIQDATGIPVVVVPNIRVLPATVRKACGKHNELKPVVVVADPAGRDRQTVRPGARVVVMPEDRSPSTIRSAFAEVLENLNGKAKMSTRNPGHPEGALSHDHR